jgi:hypothetical protein
MKKMDSVMISKMQAQIREQQADIDTIKKVLDLYNEPLHLEDFSIKSLYNAAIALEIDTWEKGWEQEWAELLIRFREEDLFQLEKITEDRHPWKPFYKLIMVIQELLRVKENYELLELYNSAREHFRKLILIWLEIKNESSLLDKLPKSEFGKLAIIKLREKYKKC